MAYPFLQKVQHPRSHMEATSSQSSGPPTLTIATAAPALAAASEERVITPPTTGSLHEKAPFKGQSPEPARTHGPPTPEHSDSNSSSASDGGKDNRGLAAEKRGVGTLTDQLTSREEDAWEMLAVLRTATLLTWLTEVDSALVAVPAPVPAPGPASVAPVAAEADQEETTDGAKATLRARVAVVGEPSTVPVEVPQPTQAPPPQQAKRQPGRKAPAPRQATRRSRRKAPADAFQTPYTPDNPPPKSKKAAEKRTREEAATAGMTEKGAAAAGPLGEEFVVGPQAGLSGYTTLAAFRAASVSGPSAGLEGMVAGTAAEASGEQKRMKSEDGEVEEEDSGERRTVRRSRRESKKPKKLQE